MKQEYISYCQNALQHSQKLELHRSFKTGHTSSSYLDLTRGTVGRRGFRKTTNKQSQTNDRNRPIQSNYEG